MDKIIRILKKDTVLVVSGIIALATSFVIPPSVEYFSYIDFKVLAVLFSLMAVIAAIREMGVFEVVAGSLLKWTGSVRSMSLALVMLAFFSSMLITNDVVLITFVPLSIEVLRRAGKGNLIFVVTMQTIAANLGSMLTPIGNPQNLYLYSRFGVSAGEFFSITIPLVIVSFILVTGLTLASGNDTVSFELTGIRILEEKRRIVFYIILFAVCLLSVFGFVDQFVMIAVVTTGIAMTTGGVLKKVDYALLLTFVFFFIIVGNVGRMGAVVESLGSLIRRRELFSSVVLSQFISNVPAAIMLSSFTDNYRMLIAGTNIGGLGTLVASLASLISYKLYSGSEGAKPFAYLKKFSLLNAAALAILCIFAVLWF